MPGTSLIVHDVQLPPVYLTADALALKESALALSGIIGKVTNPDEQQSAVEAQKELTRTAKLFEDARIEATAPFLKIQRELKATVDKERNELLNELARISTLIGNFQSLELAKVRAAEAAKNVELGRLEMERQLKLAQANSHDALDAINDEFNRAAAALPVITPARVEGQTVREDWDIVCNDLHALYRAHPFAVKLEPRLSEIRQLLDAGVKVAGVMAKKIPKVSVRLARERTAIEV